MTLTSILPTLRRSIPSPFSRDAWPVHTVPRCDDIVVEGISVSRYVSLCGTPAVMTAPAVIPLSGGMPSPTDWTTVLTVAVTAVDPAQPVVLVIDADTTDVPVRWNEARLLDRVSAAVERSFSVRDASGRVLPGVAVLLPGDVTAGDLIAMPASGAIAVGDVRPRPLDAGDAIATPSSRISWSDRRRDGVHPSQTRTSGSGAPSS